MEPVNNIPDLVRHLVGYIINKCYSTGQHVSEVPEFQAFVREYGHVYLIICEDMVKDGIPYMSIHTGYEILPKGRNYPEKGYFHKPDINLKGFNVLNRFHAETGEELRKTSVLIKHKWL